MNKFTIFLCSFSFLFCAKNSSAMNTQPSQSSMSSDSPREISGHSRDLDPTTLLCKMAREACLPNCGQPEALAAIPLIRNLIERGASIPQARKYALWRYEYFKQKPSEGKAKEPGVSDSEEDYFYAFLVVLYSIEKEMREDAPSSAQSITNRSTAT